MVADRIIPIKYNSLLGYENQPYEDDYYFYQQEDNPQSFMASTEVIPLGLICHETFSSIEEKKKKQTKASDVLKNKTMNAKDARKEKRRMLFKSMMMTAHYSFVEENGVELKEVEGFKSGMTTAFMLVMVRKDNSALVHESEESFEGVSQYKIALMNMRKFRIVNDLEDFMFLDLEIDNKIKKYFELEGEFSRRNHYRFSFENDVNTENKDNHIVNTGRFTFISEGMIVQFRLILDRLEIENTRVLVEKYVKFSPFERSTELLSGKFTPLNQIFTGEMSKYSTLTVNNNQLVLFDLEDERKIFPLPPILSEHSKKAILTCEKPSQESVFLLSNNEIFSLGNNGSAFSLNKEEHLSESLKIHLNGYHVGEICKLTSSKYLILLEKPLIDPNDITLVELFENSKWIIIDLSSKSISDIRPTIYKTRNEQDVEDGFTTVSKKRNQRQQPRHFLSNFGGELNGGTSSEVEKLNLPKFAINKRSMFSFRPFKHNQDCFVVKTFLTSSKIDNKTFDYLKAEILPVAHFSLYFHIKEEAAPYSLKQIDMKLFSDLEFNFC